MPHCPSKQSLTWELVYLTWLAGQVKQLPSSTGLYVPQSHPEEQQVFGYETVVPSKQQLSKERHICISSDVSGRELEGRGSALSHTRLGMAAILWYWVGVAVLICGESRLCQDSISPGNCLSALVTLLPQAVESWQFLSHTL